jgi:hypothetical protein
MQKISNQGILHTKDINFNKSYSGCSSFKNSSPSDQTTIKPDLDLDIGKIDEFFLF